MCSPSSKLSVNTPLPVMDVSFAAVCPDSGLPVIMPPQLQFGFSIHLLMIWLWVKSCIVPRA